MPKTLLLIYAAFNWFHFDLTMTTISVYGNVKGDVNMLRSFSKIYVSHFWQNEWSSSGVCVTIFSQNRKFLKSNQRRICSCFRKNFKTIIYEMTSFSKFTAKMIKLITCNIINPVNSKVFATNSNFRMLLAAESHQFCTFCSIMINFSKSIGGRSKPGDSNSRFPKSCNQFSYKMPKKFTSFTAEWQRLILFNRYRLGSTFDPTGLWFTTISAALLAIDSKVLISF